MAERQHMTMCSGRATQVPAVIDSKLRDQSSFRDFRIPNFASQREPAFRVRATKRCACGWIAGDRLITTAATAAATAITTTTTAAAASIFAGTRFIYRERATVVFFFVQALDRGLRFLIAAHFNEAETLASACVTIGNHLGTVYSAELRKELF